MRYTMMLAGVMTVLAAGIGMSGEPTPEALLPVHENKDAWSPSAAFGKDIYLVVWQAGQQEEGEWDIRKGLKLSSAIVGCRVGKDGRALDAKPFVISNAKDLREKPRVVFAPSTGSGQGGGVFLVVWQDLRNGKDWDVYGARVSPDGKVLDPEGILVSGGAHNQAQPRLAWDGKTFVAVWSDFRSGSRYEVFGARLSADGKVLDPQGIKVSSDGVHAYAPAVASAGDGKCMVLWVGMGPGLKNCSGTLIEDGKVAAAGVQRYVGSDYRTEDGPGAKGHPLCLAAGPKGYLCAWRNEVPSGRSDCRDSATAGTFDPAGKRGKWFCLSGQPTQRVFDPDIAWDGSAFVAAWHERRDSKLFGTEARINPYHVMFAARVSAEGVPDGKPVQLSGTFESPAAEAAVACDGAGGALVAYEKHPDKGEVPIRIAFRLLVAK